jgi:CBS-domain-containing membrane protein
MRHIWDEKFARNKLRYVTQCLLATASVLLVLLILDASRNTAVIAALGATAFLIFTMPSAPVAKTRLILGGYAIGIFSGVLCHYVARLLPTADAPASTYLASAVVGAFSVGLAILLMVVTDVEHPPAVSVALGLVLNNCEPRTILVVCIGVIALALISKLLRPLLIDLR